MNIRVAVGRFLIRVGRFVQSLSLMIMRPRDLIEFNRRTYSGPQSVRGWAEDGLVDSGLSPEEKSLLERVPFRRGKLLLLGVGGGREAVCLAAMGFEVTGVDFVPELAAKAGENARRRGWPIKVLVQDISRLDVPEASYELAWLTSGTYSSIPTRIRRLEMLERVRRSLRPGGFFICQFLFSGEREFKGIWELFRRIFSWLTLGNLAYARGDRLVGGIEFAHYFPQEEEIRSEFEAAGFEVVELGLPEGGLRGGAILKKIS